MLPEKHQAQRLLAASVRTVKEGGGGEVNLAGGRRSIPLSVRIVVRPIIIGTGGVARSLLPTGVSPSSVGDGGGRSRGRRGGRAERRSSAVGGRWNLNDGAEAAHGRHVDPAGDVGGGHGEGGRGRGSKARVRVWEASKGVRFSRVWEGEEMERHEAASEEEKGHCKGTLSRLTSRMSLGFIYFYLFLSLFL